MSKLRLLTKDAQSEFAHPRRSRCRSTGRSRCRSTVGEQTPFAHAWKVHEETEECDLSPCRIRARIAADP